MATVNALSVALFNAAAGGYSADISKNPAAYAAAVGAVLEKNLTTDAAFVAHLLENFGVATTSAVYAEAQTALTGMVAGMGRANATVGAIDFLYAQTMGSNYAAIATAFVAKVNAAATFSAANASELDVSKLIAAVTGVDTDVAAAAASFAAGAASRNTEVADLQVEVAGLEIELAFTAAALGLAAAAAEEAAAALTAANATITLINDTEYATEQAAYDAAAAAGATALAAANAAAATAAETAAAALTAANAAAATAAETAAAALTAANTAAAEAAATAAAALTAANATITLIDDTTFASESAAAAAATLAAETAAAEAAAALKVTTDATAAALQAEIDALENPAGGSFVLTTSANTVIGVGAGDVVTGTRTTLNSTDIIIDAVSGDGDILNVTASDDLVAGNAATVVGFENVNYTVQAFVTTTGTTFAIDNSGVASADITIDVDQVGSSVVSTSITGVATDSTVTASSDFTTTVTVDGDDNAAVTVVASAQAIATLSTAGALTTTTVTSNYAGTTGAPAADISSDSDGTVSFTATAADLEIDAIAATSVTAVASGSIEADASAAGTSTNLTAATTVNLTAGDEIIAEMTAATAATLSAGFGDATTVTESVITGASLTTLNISGNGSAPRFDTTAADAVRTINITGSQNVTVEMDLVAVAALTTALSVTDSSTGTSRIILANTDAGAATNLSGVGADVIELAVANTRALTFASGAAVTISADQSAVTL
jgi:hypothetical protein